VSIKILLVHQHRIFREGLQCLFAGQSDMEIVGEAATAEQAITLARQAQPDIVLIEPAVDGTETTRRIRAEGPGVRVICLSMHSDRRYAGQILRAGAFAYLVKDCAFQELCQAIRAAHAGRSYMTCTVAPCSANGMAQQGGSPDVRVTASQTLTSRELEVLKLLADGKRVKEVARTLSISAKTVESHRQNIMDKLDIHSTVELARFAVRQGLTTV